MHVPSDNLNFLFCFADNTIIDLLEICASVHGQNNDFLNMSIQRKERKINNKK